MSVEAEQINATCKLLTESIEFAQQNLIDLKLGDFREYIERRTKAVESKHLKILINLRGVRSRVKKHRNTGNLTKSQADILLLKIEQNIILNRKSELRELWNI